MSESVIDAEILASLRELQSDDSPHFLKEYFTAFLEQIPARLETISSAIASGNAKSVAFDAHALKSSCANSGANRLAALCAQLEQLGKSGSLQGAFELAKEVKDEAAKVTAEIRALPELK
jgi:two-component system, sensor histidine kinase and response regulator